MAEDGVAQGSWGPHHLPGRGKEALSDLSWSGTSLWGLHQHGHHQSAALSQSNGDAPAVSPKGGGGTSCLVPKERGEGALTWP